MVLGEDGFVVMAGFTEGDWYGTNKGERDFVAVKLDAADGRTEAWRWQVGAKRFRFPCPVPRSLPGASRVDRRIAMWFQRATWR